MKALYLICSLLIISCNNNNQIEADKEATIDVEKGKIEECFQYKFSKYFDEIEKITQVLERDFSLTKTATNYSALLKKMEDVQQISSPFLSKKEQQDFTFIIEDDIFYRIYTCTQMISLDRTLSKKQSDYYAIFNKAAEDGYLDHLALSKGLKSLNKSDFLTNGVQEITLFYIFNYLILNVYSFEK